MLKIDIDSYDIFVVERLLRHSRYRPKIIFMEISETRARACNANFNLQQTWRTWLGIVKQHSARSYDAVRAADYVSRSATRYSFIFFPRHKLTRSLHPPTCLSRTPMSDEKIPPPIMFAPNFRRNWNWQGDHFMAASASMIVQTLRPLGYRSVAIDWNNIVLVE